MMRGLEKIPILVVEDEESIREGVCDILNYHGYAPSPAVDGEEGLEQAKSGDYSLVLLDVMLPGIDGFTVCRKLREERPTLPILMLTAKGSEDDVVEGFRCGADDYVTKPFSVRELVVRIESLLRRSGKLEPSDGKFCFGPWKVDRANLRAENSQSVVELTSREVDLLDLFLREKGRIVSRRTLLQEAWGMANVEEVQTRTVDMHIAKLRKKLGDEPGASIETVRGAGYRYNG
jgi:two-component system response regulator RegX3